MKWRRRLLAVVAVGAGWVAVAAQPVPQGATDAPDRWGPGPGRRDTAVPGGTELWHVPGAGRGTPAVDASTVYAQSALGEVIALDRRTGAVRWRQRTSPPGVATAGSSVRRWDRVVIAGDEDLVALDAASGAFAWRFTPSTGYGPGHYLGDVADGVVFAGSPSGHLHAVEAVTGRLLWQVQPMAGMPVSIHEPSVREGVVVAGYVVHAREAGEAEAGGGVVAVDARTGQRRWHRHLAALDREPFTDGWGGGLAVADDVVVASARDGTTWGLDLDEGRPVWHVGADAGGCEAPPGRPDIRPLAVAGGAVVSGSLSGCVAAFERAGGRFLWRFHDVRLGSTTARFAVDWQTVYVPFFSGRLVAVDLETGRERWRLGEDGREFIWAPALAGRELWLASRTGIAAFSK